MTGVWRTIALTAFVGFSAGALGVYGGTLLSPGFGGGQHDSLDAIVHRELRLSSEQDVQLAAIEERYAGERASIEAEMRSAAREIADAVFEDKANSRRVRSAVARFHAAMGAMQDQSIEHVFEMRSALTARQQVAFDKIVHRELLSAAGDGGD